MADGVFTRRDFLATSSFSAATLWLAACASTARRAEDVVGTRPNIIFILADDLGYADLGCYGQRAILTPNLDRMATEGLRFTDCYAGATVCAPSRSVLMTGQHTGHTRVRGNMASVGGTPPEGRVSLEPEDMTVAEVLKQAGYVTGITGKWGLGEPDTSGVPNRQGFDEWFGYLNQRHAHSYYPDYLWRNEELYPLPGNANGGRAQYSHDLMTEFALQFIREHRAGPFFLYLAWTIPHATYEVPSLEPYANRPWSETEKIYAAMVTRMDRDVGRVLALLSELGIDRDTLVFFASDNGAAERWDGRFDSSGPLRGQKRDMYEGGLRSPMLVRWPGTVPAGEVSRAPWYFADVLPTLAELAGTPAPSGVDGISVLPALLGCTVDTGNRFFYWESFEGGFRQAVRWHSWKAVRPGLDQPLELYDLATDLGERQDIASQQPQIVAVIEEYLRTARTDSPNWPVG